MAIQTSIQKAIARVREHVANAPGPESIDHKVIAEMLEEPYRLIPAHGKVITANTTIANSDDMYQYMGNVLVVLNGATVSLALGIPTYKMFYIMAVAKNAYLKLPNDSVITIKADAPARMVILTGISQYYVEPEPAQPPTGGTVSQRGQRLITGSGSITPDDNGKILSFEKMAASTEQQLTDNIDLTFAIAIHNPNAGIKHRIKPVAGVQSFILEDGTAVPDGHEVYVKPESDVFLRTYDSNVFKLQNAKGAEGWEIVEPVTGPASILGSAAESIYTLNSYTVDTTTDSGTWSDTIKTKHLDSTGHGAPAKTGNWVIFDGTNDGLLYTEAADFASGWIIALAKVSAIVGVDLRMGFCVPGVNAGTHGRLDSNGVEVYCRIPDFKRSTSTADFVVGDVVMCVLHYQSGFQSYSISKINQANYTPVSISRTEVTLTTNSMVLGMDPYEVSTVYSPAQYHEVVRCNVAPTAEQLEQIFQYYKSLNLS